MNKQGEAINNQTNKNGVNRLNSREYNNIDLLPPEFQIDSDSSNPDESDSSLGEDCDESDSESESSSSSALSNPLLSKGTDGGSGDSSDGSEDM